MLLRCLKAEIRKCRRSPVWLAFLILPIFPAILGTGNYLGNIEVRDPAMVSLLAQARPLRCSSFSVCFLPRRWSSAW